MSDRQNMLICGMCGWHIMNAGMNPTCPDCAGRLYSVGGTLKELESYCAMVDRVKPVDLPQFHRLRGGDYRAFWEHQDSKAS